MSKILSSDSIESTFHFASVTANDQATAQHSAPELQAQEKVKDDYVVKAGDTLSKLAERRGISVKTILKDNPQVKNADEIRVGEHLQLTEKTGTTIYTVKGGDALTEVAEKHQTSVGDILRSNQKQITNQNLIFPGQKIFIPVKTPNQSTPINQIPANDNTPEANPISGAKFDLDNFLAPKKGSDAGFAILIGNAEGNRTADGGFRKAYYGHRDPGDGLWNIGSFSRANDRFKGKPPALTPEEADKLHLEHIEARGAKDDYVAALSEAKLEPNNPLLASVYFDAFNQSERAADKMLEPEILKHIEDEGVSIETMKEWRVAGYVNPETDKRWLNKNGSPVGGGLAKIANQQAEKKHGRPATEQEIQQLIERDQGRRVDELIPAMKNMNLLPVQDKFANAKDGGIKDGGLKQPLSQKDETTLDPSNKELSREEVEIPHVNLKSGSNIRLSPHIVDKFRDIATEYYEATGKDLTITDGNRSPLEQAFMMIRQIRKGSIGIYRAKAAANEIKKTYNGGVAQDKSDKEIAGDIALQIKEQMKKGIYISAHLKNNGADVRSWDMTPSDEAEFIEIVEKNGGEVVNENDHLHVQWSKNFGK